jgi:ADP-heptose:LPS heptosyltransferase
MLRDLLSRFRQFSRQRRQRQQRANLDRTDAAALAMQAPPDPSRLLVVRNDSIGDYLLYRPWLRRLTEVARGRGQRVTLLANALWAPLARAWDADIIEEVVAVEFGRFTTDLAYRAEVLRGVGKAGFGEVVYPLHVREAAVENFIRFMRAPVRVASQGEHRTGPWFEALDAGYSRRLPTTRAVLFEYDRNGEFFENWRASEAAALILSAAPPTPLRLPEAVLTAGAAETAAGGPYVVLFPGASARQKRWPAGHFAQLASALHQHYGSQYRLVLAGSPADAAEAAHISRVAGPAVPLDNRCGRTDLPGLAALVAGAHLLISNDTVAAHLAAQAGTPCVVVLMGENYGKFFPYPPPHPQPPWPRRFPPSQEARFAQGDFSPPATDPDISQITPARVLAAACEVGRWGGGK